MNKLGTILDEVQEVSGAKIDGVNTAYLYFGMWKAGTTLPFINHTPYTYVLASTVPR